MDKEGFELIDAEFQKEMSEAKKRIHDKHHQQFLQKQYLGTREMKAQARAKDRADMQAIIQKELDEERQKREQFHFGDTSRDDLLKNIQAQERQKPEDQQAGQQQQKQEEERRNFADTRKRQQEEEAANASRQDAKKKEEEQQQLDEQAKKQQQNAVNDNKKKELSAKDKFNQEAENNAVKMEDYQRRMKEHARQKEVQRQQDMNNDRGR